MTAERSAQARLRPQGRSPRLRRNTWPSRSADHALRRAEEFDGQSRRYRAFGRGASVEREAVSTSAAGGGGLLSQKGTDG